MWSPFVWDSSRSLGLIFAGAQETNFPISSSNDVMEFQVEVPFLTDGWLTGPVYDLGGILSVGELSWEPTSQPGSVGPVAVKFQVASSSMQETPSDFVGPDGTANTYFTDPEGTEVGDHHLGAGRIAYRMYFHTDDTTISPTLTSVSMKVYRHETRGTYTSPVHDLGQERSSMESLTYRSALPPDVNTNLVKVTVKIRTSTNADMSSPTAWETVDKDDSTINTPYGRYFQFEVTITTDSLKRHLTPVFSGITIEYNSPPVLTGGVIDRIDGDRTTEFTYTITYTDVDNNEPTVKNVYIDNIPHAMSSADIDFTDGAVFSFTTRLALGEHDFWFEFSDGKNTVRDPPTNLYSGPEVLNRDPVPVIDFPSDSSRFVPNEPVEFSAASSHDPDHDGITFRWVSSVQGELATTDSFIKTLIEGDHQITLTVTDEHDAVTTSHISILVKPYLPYLEIRDFFLDKTDPTEKDKVTANVVVYNTGEATAGPAIVEFLVNDEVVDTYEEHLDVDDRLTTTFTWTAEGTKSYLAVRTRPGYDMDVDEALVKTVNVTANSPPVISFDIYPVEPVVDEPVNFINNGTSDADSDKLTYLWEFGDGATSSDVTIQHTYVLKGTYVASLTVTDTRGGETTQLWTIVVKEKPVEDSGGISMAMMGGIAAAVLVVIVLVVFFLRRK